MSTQPAASRFWKTALARRTPIALIAAAGLAIAAGCEQAEAPEEITSAQATLLSVSAGGLSAPTESRRRAYQSVVSDLQRASSDYEGVAAETATALMGEAQAGLAQIEQAEAADRASEVSALLATARLAASEFVNQSAIASAMRQGDSGADLDRISQEAAANTQQIEQARIDREGVVAQVAQLNRRQQEQREQANAIRRQEADVRQEAIRADADRRAELTEQAYRLARRAAEFERAASDLQAQADVILPEVRNAEIREQQLRTLGAQLEATRKAIEDERARRLEDARAAQAVADAANDRLAQTLDALRDAITAGFEPASDEAVAAFNRAIQTLRRANSRLALASAQQGLGDAQRLRATVFEQTESLMDALAGYTPAPPAASEAASFADDMAGKAEQARSEVATAYADAAGNLRSGAGRASGEVRDRVDAAVGTLESLAASLRGETPAQDDAPVDESAPADAAE